MTQDSLIGIQLDEYRLEALLGRGGMARVYRAVDVRLNRYAAIKVIDAPFRADPEYTRRFEREAQAIAQIDHPHVVRLYRYGEADLGDAGGRILYMAMQYIHGADLAYVLDTYRRDGAYIEPSEALRIASEVGAALDAIHAHGIIHRDVKPSNIMLTQEGKAVLTDFGLAMLQPVGTMGEVFGSPHYIAPEQARSSAEAVPQSDLYALGVILYEMFTGQVPFRGSTPLDIAMLHLSSPPPPPRQVRPELSPAVEAVILKALAKQPGDRHATGRDLAADLAAALAAGDEEEPQPPAGEAVPATRLTLPERVRLGQTVRPPAGQRPPGLRATPPTLNPAPAAPAPARRRPWTWLTVGLAVTALISLACLALFGLALADRLRRASEGQATRVAATQSLPTRAAVVAPLPTPTATRPVPTATATGLSDGGGDAGEAGGGYRLVFIRCPQEGCLVVVNQGNVPFPLDTLQLESKEAGLRGTEWGAAELPPDGCVRAVKDENWASRLPEGVACEPVGHLLLREGPERFWKDQFTITIEGRKAATCKKNSERCVVEGED